MVLAGILLFMVLTPVAWIVFAPVVATIDTRTRRYEVRQPASFRIFLDPNHHYKPCVRILGITINTTSKSESKPRLKPKQKRKPISKSIDTWLYLVRNIAKSFRITELNANVDTGDVALNAQLVPVAWLLTGGPVSIQTNFHGINYLYARVRVRIYSILWTILLFTIKK